MIVNDYWFGHMSVNKRQLMVRYLANVKGVSNKASVPSDNALLPDLLDNSLNLQPTLRFDHHLNHLPQQPLLLQPQPQPILKPFPMISTTFLTIFPANWWVWRKADFQFSQSTCKEPSSKSRGATPVKTFDNKLKCSTSQVSNEAGINFVLETVLALNSCCLVI